MLQKFIQVDVYGGCKNLGAKRCDGKKRKCFDYLNENYMFYLAFENNFCSEYVTEKFFNTMQSSMIPVVLGGANYSNVAPPHSYINAMLYSPEELAKILHR